MRMSSALASIGLHLAMVMSVIAAAVWLPHQKMPSLASDQPHIEMIKQNLAAADNERPPQAVPIIQRTLAPLPPPPTADITALPKSAPSTATAASLVPPPAAEPAPATPAPSQPAGQPIGQQAGQQAGQQTPGQQAMGQQFGQQMASLAAPPSSPPSSASAAPRSAPAPDAALGAAAADGPGIIPPSPDNRRNVPPQYPAEARRRGEEGRVVLMIHVAADGHVAGVDIQRTSGSSLLDQAARHAAQRWHFRPAMQGLLAMDANFETEILFQLTDH